MASSGVVDFNKRKAEEERGYPTPNSHWDDPAPGINGHFCLGHHLNIVDPLTVAVTVDGKPANHVHRNHWTPAWMDTIYRSEIDPEYYPNAGTFVLREKKAITCSDVFVSHMALTNEKREPSLVELEISMPMEEEGESLYAVHAMTVPDGLGNKYPVDGYAAISTSAGQHKWKVEIPPFGTVHFRYRDMNLYGTQADGPSLKRVIGTEIETFEMLEIEQRYQKITAAEKQAVIDNCISKWKFLSPAKQEGLEKAAGYYLAVKSLVDDAIMKQFLSRMLMA